MNIWLNPFNALSQGGKMIEEIYDYEAYLSQVNSWDAEKLPQFASIPRSSIILFVSHCVKDPIYDLILELAEHYWLRVEKAGGFSQVEKLVAKIVNQKKPLAVIGIACFAELSKARPCFQAKKIPALGIPLTCEGCHSTEVDYFLVNDLLFLVNDLLAKL